MICTSENLHKILDYVNMYDIWVGNMTTFITFAAILSTAALIPNITPALSQPAGDTSPVTRGILTQES